MWKDQAIDMHITKIFELLIGNIEGIHKEVIFVMEFGGSYVATSAIYYDANGVRHGVEDFFSIADLLKEHAMKFHLAFEVHGENFKSAKVVLGPEDEFQIDFSYEDFNRWDLSDTLEFPKHK